MSDNLGFNKIAGAVLATALAFIGIRELSHAAYHPHIPDVPSYGAQALADAQAAASAGPAVIIDLPFPQADWVKAMDADAGAKVFAKCKSCHTIEQGGKTLTGPNLYGIVGMASAQRDSFAYSSVMKNSGLSWDYETLDAFLKKPSKYLKGTKMSFVGLKKPEQRAAIIEYLRVNASAPVDRPVPVSAEPTQMEETIVEAMDDSHATDEHAGDDHGADDGH